MIVSELKRAANAILVDPERQTRSDGNELPLLDYLLEARNCPQALNERSLLFLFKRIYGTHDELIRDKLTRLDNLCGLFLKLYGDGPLRLLRAPARINVLGEHIDYVSYIPTASLSFGSRERDMLMMYRPSETGRVCAASTSPAYPMVAFTLNQGPSIPVDGSTEDNWLS